MPQGAAGSLLARLPQLTQLPDQKNMRASLALTIAYFSVLGNKKTRRKRRRAVLFYRSGTTFLSGLMPYFGAPDRIASTTKPGAR